MSFFSSITAESVTVEKPKMGNKFLVESGSHDFTIDAAYLTPTKNGGAMFNVVFKNEEATVKFESFNAIFILRKDEQKGMVNYKDDPSKPYFGYKLVDELALVTTGKHLHECGDPEDKFVPIYNFEQKAEVPTKVKSLEALRGKKVTVGMIKSIVDKTKWDGEKNQPTGETREINEISVFFNTETKQAAFELKHGVAEGAKLYHDTWVEKNAGVTRNKAKGASNGATQGAPVQAQQTAVPNLFGN